MTSTPVRAPHDSDDVPTRALIARIWREYLGRRWAPLLGAAVCSAGMVIFAALLAQTLKPAIDNLKTLKSGGAIYLIPLEIVGFVLARGAFQIGQALLINRAGNRVVSDMQSRLFGKLVRADLARLRTAHTGSYVASVLYDATLIRVAFTDAVVGYFREGLTVIAMIAVMAMNDLLLTALVLIGAPVALLVIGRYARRTHKAAKGAMAETSNLSTAVMESLDGVKIVKIENREDFEEGRVREVVERRQKHMLKGANAKAFATPSAEIVTMTIMAGVFAVAGWRSQTAGMTQGSFAAFVGAMLIANQSLRQLATLQGSFAEGFAAARRLFAALDVEPEIREPAHPKPIPDGPCEVRFEDVSFAYHHGAPALSEVSIVARPGETVALVGPSGGGKSTLLNLIPRFYDPDSGRVMVNQLDSRDADISRLRAKIALVTQEPFLFDDTIRANIAYARPDAPMAEIEAAAEAAAAHEFIETLPDGYDTSVGEAGARLSGGQRQRIAIARAFLKDAPILLLDEATSALDTESEAKVQAALERLMKGRTTLLIAHRLSTVRGASRIYVIDGGRVVEEGTHASLMAHGGLYARLARSQDLEEPAQASVDGPALKALP